MKKILSVALLTLMINLSSCQSSTSNAQNQAQQGGIKSVISVDDFEKKLSATPGAQPVDVRTPEEYAGGHLKNAVNINVRADDFEQQAAKLDKTKPVMVYCKAGSRSAAAASKLQEMGFTEIYDMDGGIMKWEAAGKPEEQGAAAPKQAGITVDSLNKVVTQNKYVLVDYNAKWCEPCKKMAPWLEAMAVNKKEKLSLVKLDADDNKELMKQKGISAIPYLELYQDGKLVWKHDGLIDESQLLKETKL